MTEFWMIFKTQPSLSHWHVTIGPSTKEPYSIDLHSLPSRTLTPCISWLMYGTIVLPKIFGAPYFWAPTRTLKEKTLAEPGFLTPHVYRPCADRLLIKMCWVWTAALYVWNTYPTATTTLSGCKFVEQHKEAASVLEALGWVPAHWQQRWY